MLNSIKWTKTDNSPYARNNSLTQHKTKATLKTSAKIIYLSHSLTKCKTKVTLIILSKIICILLPYKQLKLIPFFFLFSFSPNRKKTKTS